MSIKKVFAVAIGCLLMAPLASLAATTVVVSTPVESPTAVYASQFDIPVFNFTLATPATDELQTLTVQNMGSARPDYEIAALKLWRDTGSGTFEGFAVDMELSSGVYDASTNQWIFYGVHERIAGNAQFFVSVETLGRGTDNKTLRFTIPQYSDANANGVYDPGDFGIFVGSHVALPTSPIDSALSAYYRVRTGDAFAPVAVITDPANGLTITNEPTTIRVRTRDAGGGTVNSVTVCVERLGSSPTLVCNNPKDMTGYGEWVMLWKPLMNTTYHLTATVTDSVGNQTVTPVTSVMVNIPALTTTTPPPPSVTGNATYLTGRWIKIATNSSVYFLDTQNVRHAYPTQDVYRSYFGTDFSRVELISADSMAGYKLGRNVPFNDGVLVKVPFNPKVYKVEAGVLHWVASESVAVTLFGSTWATVVKELPEIFFMEYTEGDPLTQ
jgi:hypothetical protein